MPGGGGAPGDLDRPVNGRDIGLDVAVQRHTRFGGVVPPAAERGNDFEAVNYGVDEVGTPGAERCDRLGQRPTGPCRSEIGVRSVREPLLTGGPWANHHFLARSRPAVLGPP